MEALTKIAAIIATLGEMDGSPESTLYMFCDMDLHAWNMLRDIMIKAEQIQIKNHYVTLTEKGKETAARLSQKDS